MELGFDKEIDAILRKARDSGGAAARAAKAPVSPHLDADAIAAFAENAIPEASRSLYIAHFADCDRCRKVLSQSVLSASSERAVETADNPVVVPAATNSGSWLSGIFKLPGFALAMGGLLVAFLGVMGYLAIQQRSSTSNSAISKVIEPYGSGSANAPAPSFANSNAMAAANAANTAATSNASLPTPVAAANTSANTSAARPGLPATSDSSLDKEVTAGAAAPEAAKPMVTTVAPPAPPPSDQPKTEAAREAEERKPKDEKKAAVSRRDNIAVDGQDRVSLAAKTRGNASGPTNAQVQQQDNTVNVQSAPANLRKQAGGKQFNFRDGVWYDAAYHGQPTTNVRRGSDQFQKLDGGLKNIANSISGTVVVVWKANAFRIQ